MWIIYLKKINKMFWYTLNNKVKFDINKKTIDEIFKNISNNINIEQKWILNIVFLDDDSIQILNKNYRNKDSVTDVLSFHYFEDFSWLDDEDIAWEIIMNENKIISQWKEYWLWSEWEFYKLLIHSVFHILWFDHEEDKDYTIMQEKEELIWSSVFEK